MLNNRARKMSVPQLVAVFVATIGLILIVYAALNGASPVFYALGAMDLLLAAVLWRIRRKPPAA